MTRCVTLRHIPLLGWLVLITSLAWQPGTRIAMAQTEAERLSQSFREAARIAAPAVVTIKPLDNGEIPADGRFPGVSTRSRSAPALPEMPTITRAEGGSGVLINAAKGWIITSDHVLGLATTWTVTLHDGRERPVLEARRDPRSDLAVVRIEPVGPAQATWGEARALDVGDWVLAIGQPFGLADTVTAGIISGKGRGLAQVDYEDLLQTDAAINPGNSGGPLINLKGHVVGINTALKTLGLGYQGVGFAIPAERARRIANDLIERGRVRRSQLGISIVRADSATTERLRYPGAVVLTAIAAGSAADSVDLRPGDLLLELDGQPIGGVGMLQSRIENTPAGTPIKLELQRQDQRLSVVVRPTEQQTGSVAEPVASRASSPEPSTPSPRPANPPVIIEEPAIAEPGVETASRRPNRFTDLGLRLAESTEEQARRHGLPNATPGLIVVGVDPNGSADRGGLTLGMLITDAGGRRITHLADLRAAVLEARQRPSPTQEAPLILRIFQGDRPGFRVLMLPQRPGAPGGGPDPLKPDALDAEPLANPGLPLPPDPPRTPLQPPRGPGTSPTQAPGDTPRPS